MTSIVTRLGCRRVAQAVLGVDGAALEPEAAVEPDGSVVVLLDVEEGPLHPAVAQVAQAYEGERPTEPAALLGRPDAQDVDLPGAFFDLRPVEADHPSVPERHEEAARVEPWLGHPLLEVRACPAALLRMAGERLGVDRQPLRVIGTRPEGPHR